MLIYSIKMQLSELFRKKTVVFTFFILLFFVLANFYQNMFHNLYQDEEVKYISQMYDPIKLLTLSDWSTIGYFMMEYYPLLVVLPTACAYLTDKNTKMKTYIVSRTGCKNYWYGKVISVFLITFFIFTVPFLMELLLECICFDMQSAGEPSNIDFIQTIERENLYFLYQIGVPHKIIYAALLTVLFGIVSGILAVFNFAVSTLPFFKYKVFTFFPVYILFYLLSVLEKRLGLGYTLNYYFILRMFNVPAMKYNFSAYFIFLIILLFISLIFIKIKTIRDDLI